MLARAAAIWVAGLVTLVPAAAWHLLFHAPREQYAALIVFILFWAFGYWGVVGPLLAAIKARRVIRAIQAARSPEELRATLASPAAAEAFVDFVATENRVPRWLARRIYNALRARLGASPVPSPTRDGPA